MKPSSEDILFLDALYGRRKCGVEPENTGELKPAHLVEFIPLKWKLTLEGFEDDDPLLKTIANKYQWLRAKWAQIKDTLPRCKECNGLVEEVEAAIRLRANSCGGPSVNEVYHIRCVTVENSLANNGIAEG